MSINLNDDTIHFSSQRTPELLTDVELAKHLQVKLATLRKWRFQRKGPPWLKIENTLVRYDLTQVLAYLNSLPGSRDELES